MASKFSADFRDLLALQHGVISRRQALASGFAPDAVEARVRLGRWTRLQRGTYATFTGRPPREALLWAALLRAGDDAVLSHETAAELVGLADQPSPQIHVTVPAKRRPATARRIPGVIVHRSDRVHRARHPSALPPRTRIEETVLDLTQAAPTFDAAFTWLCRAAGRRLTTPARLRMAVDARRKLRWRIQISAALDGVAAGVRSLLEFRYLNDVERPHGLPRASRQARRRRPTGSAYLDNLYEDYLVGIELDGRAAHPIEERWRDIRRDNAGAAEGIVTLRFGWSDVTVHPCQTAAQVAEVLRHRGWTGAIRRCGPGCTAEAAARGSGRAGTLQRQAGADPVQGRPGKGSELARAGPGTVRGRGRASTDWVQGRPRPALSWPPRATADSASDVTRTRLRPVSLA
jgi:hypothetical protein